jgi:hypothetical protein
VKSFSSIGAAVLEESEDHTSEAEGLDKDFAGLFPWIDALFERCICRRTGSR